MRLKEGTSKARGYCGWHVSWDNKRCYLRSLGEYVVACMLDTEQKPYLTEKKIFLVGDHKYKPDFLIFEDTTYNSISSIIEVKGQGDVISAKLYIDRFEPFFSEINIQYTVIYRFDALKTKYCNKEKQDNWKAQCAENSASSSISGELNPMFGKHHSTKTRKLIGDKARERLKDPEYAEKCRVSQSLFWDTPRGAARKLELRALRQEEKRKRDAAYLLLPDIESSCKCCGATMIDKNEHDFCSRKCKTTWKKINVDGYGKQQKEGNRYRQNLITYIKKICLSFNISAQDFLKDLDTVVKRAKMAKLIPKNKGISEKTLIKFNITLGDLNGATIDN